MSQESEHDHYDYYCLIYLDYNLINLGFGSNLNQQIEASFALMHFERHPAVFTYNKYTCEIVDWGHAAEETFEALPDYVDNQIVAEEIIQSSRFFHRSILAEIWRLYCNQNNNKEAGHEDETRLEAIGRFLGAVCKQAYKNSATQLSNSQFVFIVPTEWDHNIKTHFLPRLFQYGGIISNEYYKNRIIFTTVLESTVAALQEEHYFRKYGIQFLREEEYLHCDLYINDLESPTELVLQAFKVENEQTLTDLAAISERTRRLLIPKLANTSPQDPIKLVSCKSVALEFKSKASTLMNYASGDWKERLQSCIDEVTTFDDREADETNTADHTKETSTNLSYAKLIRSTCAIKEKTLFAAINDYLKHNNHRQISFIILTFHDNLPPSQNISDLYFYCLAENLKHFPHARIQILGESRWASPKFGGPEIVRGGLFKLLESLKFANTERPSSIDTIQFKFQKAISDSPFVCGYPGCGWTFVHPEDTKEHRRVHNKAKLLIPTPTFESPETSRQQNYTQDEQSLFLFMDIKMESTCLCLSLLDEQYKTHRKINLADNCLVGLPPLSCFISLSPEENGKMALTAKKIFFDLVNNLHHDAFRRFCNDNNNGNIRIHDFRALNSKFTFDHYYQYFAKSDLAWSTKTKNESRIIDLEEILYHNRGGDSNEHTSGDPLHVITFILLYIGYVYHKMDMILEKQKKEALQDVNLNPETKVMLVLQDLLLSILPLDALNDCEIRLNLCGLRGNSSKITSSQSNFSISTLQQSLSKQDKPFTRSYYVHAEINEEKINFKLNQIIQTAAVDNNIGIMPLLLKQRIVNINQTNESISRSMWNYIWRRQVNQLRKAGSLHLMNAISYLSFKSRITEFISKILRFSKHAQKLRREIAPFYDRKYRFEYHSDCQHIALSLREIVEIAVRPSMRNIAVSILSVFKNVDAFALYSPEALLLSGESISPYYSCEFRALVGSILKKEILDTLKSNSLDVDVKFSIDLTNTDVRIESLDEIAFEYKRCLEKKQLSTRSRHNYALKFNFAQGFSVENDGSNQQTMEECSIRNGTRIPANFLYVLVTERTKINPFLRYFKNAETNNAVDLESIELVKFEQSKQVFANPGDSILGLSVPYTTVHRFGLEDLWPQNLPIVVSVTPLHYLSLLEVSIEVGNTSQAILPSLLREKQTLSYEYV